LSKAIAQDLVASTHGIYRGGLSAHLALKTMAGNLGLRVDLSALPAKDADRDDILLYSESAGRFIVTVNPQNQQAFESHFNGLPAALIGQVTELPHLQVRGLNGQTIIDLNVSALKNAWQQTFGNQI
jgi:phosphoribosylformylglycinamidine synthase